MKNKIPLAVLALLGTSAAQAAPLYSTSFDTSEYTAGASVAGRDGWFLGSSSDPATQTVASGVGRDGTQGLRIANAASTGYYSVSHALPGAVQGFDPFTVSVDLYMDETTAASRMYELALLSSPTGGMATSSVLLGMSIGGDGKIRASSSWATLYGTNTQRVTAAAGTFKSRWLNLTLKVDENRTGVATIRGLGDGSTFYTYTIPAIGYDSTTQSYKSILTANLVAENTGAFGGVGVGTFDNFNVTAVPEPATLAALGLGAAALLRRRRKV
ncbi:PEP-CTERM sorting domain-containing protein [bacterium]|nr:MAG: PEP-CTERM sorting domain-containing protein [bacterium]